jgi:hypothetical protein
MTHENSSSRQPPLHWRATQSCEQLLVNKLTFADEAAVRAARGVYVLLGPRPTGSAPRIATPSRRVGT